MRFKYFLIIYIDWQAFPEKCKVVEATKPHILNCVRVGTGIFFKKRFSK